MRKGRDRLWKIQLYYYFDKEYFEVIDKRYVAILIYFIC
jgi:hypothetical protein